jgi:hypothetical protein
MAGSLAAVKKELRKTIRDILKDLPEAAAASQSMTPSGVVVFKLMHPSFQCDQDTTGYARVQSSTQNKHLPVYAGRRNFHK